MYIAWGAAALAIERQIRKQEHGCIASHSFHGVLLVEKGAPGLCFAAFLLLAHLVLVRGWEICIWISSLHCSLHTYQFTGQSEEREGKGRKP